MNQTATSRDLFCLPMDRPGSGQWASKVRRVFSPSRGGRFARMGATGCWCFAASVFLAARPVTAQEALRNSLADNAQAQARQLQPDSMPYNFKSGDFRLLVVPSLAMDWNDNVNTVSSNPQQDFIVNPMLRLTATYPVSQRNLLSLDVGVGYREYLQHRYLSTWDLQSGTRLSFDVYIKDFTINLHDRVSYVQDSAQEAAIAGTAQYGIINNVAGLGVTWDLGDVTLSLGYDHANIIAQNTTFQSQTHASELVDFRPGVRLHPTLTVGVEGTAAFTTYDQTVLNNNDSYSAGVYADWRPGAYFQVQPRAGYTVTRFQQTSQTIQTSDLTSWYADLTLTHKITDAVSYSLSAGHEIRLGIQSDAIEDTYVRPSVTWNIIKDLALQSSLSYEHGKQGEGNIAGNLAENYDWFWGSIGLSHPLTNRLRAGLNYRATFRSSDVANRGYTQNLVGLQLTYQFQ